MADILTRLLLNTSQFDANLNNAKQSVNSYQSSVSSMAATAGAGIAKFAGGVGLAIGAGDAFMKVIEGSQATSDEFENNMNACRDSVDAFFIALSTGDFSAFENGLLGVFSKAKELSAELDDIADKRMSVDFVNLKKEGQMTELEAIIRDNSKSKEERRKALDSYKIMMKGVADSRLDIAKEELSGNTAVELNKIGVKNLSKKDVDLYLSKLNNKDLNSQFLKELEYIKGYTEKYNAAWENVASYRRRNGVDDKSIAMENEFNKKWNTPDEALKITFHNSEFRDVKQLLDFGKLFQQNDHGRAVLYEFASKLVIAQNQNEADYKKMIRLSNSINKKDGSTSKHLPKDELLPSDQVLEINKQISVLSKRLASETSDAAKSSVQKTIDELNKHKNSLMLSTGDIDKQLSDLNKKMSEAQTVDLRRTIQKTIDELQDKKLQIQIDLVGSESMAGIDLMIADLNKKLLTETNDQVRRAVQKTIDELQNKKIILNVITKRDPESIISELRKQSPTLGYKNNDKTSPGYGKYHKDSGMGKAIKSNAPTDTKALKERLKHVNENIEANNNLTTSLGAISSMMGSISGMVDEDAAAWMQWGSSLFSTIGQAITEIISLTGAKKADAVAGAIEQSQSVPFPANIFSIGASVAAVIAAFAAMPAFDSGGMIPGTSFSGDKVLARVNSGEMVLNASQQSKLFKLANSGNLSSGGRNISVTGDVRFKIDGTTLVGVLKNINDRNKHLR